MKKLPITSFKIPFRLLRFSLLLLLYFGMLWAVRAATLTVDNNTGSIAQYSTLQAAIDAASAGDIILIKGSATAYTRSVDKQLKLIGEGYKPNKQGGTATKIGTLTLVAGAGSTEITGLNITTTYINANMTNLVFDRCYLGTISTYYGSATSVGLVVRNCIMVTTQYTNGLTFAGTQVDLIAQNSVFARERTIFTTNLSSTILFDHCHFISTTIAGYWSFAVSNYNITVTNSTLHNCAVTYLENHTFSNNIFNNNVDPIYGTGSGGNNLLETDPLFTLFTNNSFDYNADFRLQSNSPGKSAASDGTDIGIYGGSYSFPVGGEGEYLMAPAPRAPQIYEMNIQNASVPENGTLSIQVKARKID